MVAVQLFFSGHALATEKLKIVATLPPIYSLLAMVTEGTPVELQLLLPQGADPHHFALRPSQARMLEEADLVFFASRDLEVFLQKYVEQRPEKYLAAFESADSDLSHAWLSPYHAERLLRGLRYYLEKTSGTKDVWNDNTKQAVATLREHNARWTAILTPYQGETLWADYLNFAPFTEHFGLIIKPFNRQALTALEQSAEPQCIVVTHTPNTLAEKTGETLPQIRIVTVNMLGAAYPADKELYFKLLDEVVEKLRGCLT